ncbi:hypothetical protein HD593_001787 [Nonomuraea rubra]|uniref:Group II intron maturase-specific domain-containing protein n=2 Tax=Nonomuraea rubra TaxID=46180 RepID=A0A7X0TWX6_9ACTN|nr:hypothetical protein [Nonomuraea rubra]
MNYYGRFYRSELHPLRRRINAYLVRWMRKKYKRLRTHKKALAAWDRTTTPIPALLRTLAVGFRVLTVRLRRAR